MYHPDNIFSQFPSTCSSSRKCLLQWVTWYLSWTSSWLASETVSPSGASKSNDQIWQINPMAGRYAGRAGQFIGLCARVFGSFINEFMSSNKGKIFAHWSSTKNTSSTFRFTQLRFQIFFRWFYNIGGHILDCDIWWLVDAHWSATFGLVFDYIRVQHFHMILYVRCTLMWSNPRQNVAL